MAEEIEVQTQEVPLDQAEMAEYRKARAEGKTFVERPVPAEEEKTEEVETAKPEASETEEEKPKEEPKKHGGGFQKRIERMTKDHAQEREARLAAERRAEAAERRALELEGKFPKAEPEKPKTQSTEDDPTDPRPKEEDFNFNPSAFTEAMGRWAYRQERKAEKEAEVRKEAQAKADAILQEHQQSMKEARAMYEDFDEVVDILTPWSSADPNHNPTPQDREEYEAFEKAVTKSGMSGHLTYYYGNHRDELKALYGIGAEEITTAVFNLRNKLKNNGKEDKPKIVSKAAPPIRPVGNGNSSRSTVPLDQMSMTDYRKARSAGRIS